MHELLDEDCADKENDEIALNSIRAILQDSNIRRTIDNTISSIDEILSTNGFKPNCREKINQFKIEVRAGKINNESFAEDHFELFIEKTKKTKESLIIIKCMKLLALASIAEENSSLMSSWNLVARAKFELGYYIGLTCPHKSLHAERARTVADKRLKKSARDYELLTNLMESLKPTKGWKTPHEASKTVGLELANIAIDEREIECNTEEERSKIVNDHIQIVLNSIIENSEINKIYQAKPKKHSV